MTAQTEEPTNKALIGKDFRKTINQNPRPGEMVKAGELIDAKFTDKHLTLQDGRVFDCLLETAWPEIQDRVRAGRPVVGHWFYCSIKKLRASHVGNERVKDSIDRLATTQVFLPKYNENGEPYFDRHGNIEVRKSTLLAGETGYTLAENAPNAEVRYGFNEGLVTALNNSHYWGRVKSVISFALTSKYAYRLYQAAALRVNLHQKSEEFSVAEFRDLLAVEAGTYPNYAQFNQKILAVALDEVNGLSDVLVDVRPIRKGVGAVERSSKSRAEVIGYRMDWQAKSPVEWEICKREIGMPKVGRRERLKEVVSNMARLDLRRLQEPDLFDGLDDYAPPPPKAAALVLKPDTLEKAKAAALKASGVRVDIYMMESMWREWAGTLKEPPKSPDAHFIAFVKERAHELA